MHTCMLSHFSCVRHCANPMDCSPQAPLSMGFSRQEYWSGLPCPSSGDFPDPAIESVSPVEKITDIFQPHHLQSFFLWTFPE